VLLIFKKLYELNEFKLLNIVELDTDELIMLSYTDNPEQLISDKHVKLL
jgi:hypothetical protein